MSSANQLVSQKEPVVSTISPRQKQQAKIIEIPRSKRQPYQPRYIPFVLRRPRYKRSTLTGEEIKVSGYRGFESKYPDGVNDKLILQAVIDFENGRSTDPNRLLVIQKKNERRIQELERQTKQEILDENL